MSKAVEDAIRADLNRQLDEGYDFQLHFDIESIAKAAADAARRELLGAIGKMTRNEAITLFIHNGGFEVVNDFSTLDIPDATPDKWDELLGMLGFGWPDAEASP